MTKHGSIKEILAASLAIFRKYQWVFLGSTATVLVVRSILNLSDKINIGPIAGFVLLLVASLLDLELQLGYIKLTLKSCQNEIPKFMDLFSCFPLLGKFVVSGAIFLIIAVVYLFLAVLMVGKDVLLNPSMLMIALVPLLLVFVRFVFFPYLMVQKNLGPIASLNASLKLTQHRYFEVLFILAIFLLVNLTGALCLLVGLLFTLPLTSIALTWYYLKISSEPEEIR